ncbi:MAG: 30S ribosomal protein S17 [Acidimicrobiales bacterium]
MMAATETTERANRKTRDGVVTSIAMDKTVVVAVESRKPHPRYGKTMARSKKFYVHDEINDAREGDRVRIMETRPMSKTKRWRLVEILERAK